MLKPQSIDRYKEFLARDESEYNKIREEMKELDDYTTLITMKKIDAPRSVWQACIDKVNALYKKLDEASDKIVKDKIVIRMMEQEVGSTISLIQYGENEYVKNGRLIDKTRSGIVVKDGDDEIKISYNKVNNFSI